MIAPFTDLHRTRLSNCVCKTQLVAATLLKCSKLTIKVARYCILRTFGIASIVFTFVSSVGQTHPFVA